MSLKDEFNKGRTWQDKVLSADKIWKQVQSMLSEDGLQMPKTPRRPDVRLIINNISGRDIQFQNPGDHSGSKPELIPATGDSTAAMVMVKGATLNEQYKNAEILFKKYDLGAQGLSKDFISALRQGKLAALIDEAYGPAPFEAQAGKLSDVTWTEEDGTLNRISPRKGMNAVFGARMATEELVFMAQFHIYVHGTGTTPELVESTGINIAVNSDWETGKETTRPIAPSIARIYYGDHFKEIPAVTVHPDGKVKEIDLMNGKIVTLNVASKKKTRSMPPAAKL